MNEAIAPARRPPFPLPPPPEPRGLYTSIVIHAGIAYASGQVSREAGEIIRGPVGHDTPTSDISRAAQACVANALSALAHEVGSLDRIARLLFLRGFVAAAPDFTGHSLVLDAASQTLIALLGDRGHHARSAVGVSSLPGGGLLEIELVAALKP
jgi:enamine deaminase RidA (YjgF/YER057c/UK114 family)